MNESEAPPASPLTQPGEITQSPDVMQLRALAAQLAILHAQREPITTALDSIKHEIDRLETLAHQTMAACGLQSFTTDAATLTIKRRTVFRATDWPTLYAHLQQTGEFDLLTRTLSSTAVAERDKAGTLPPGILRAEFDQLKFTPTKGKKQ